MRLNVPYFEQSTDVTCGPASMRMILAYFNMEEKEAALARELRTNTTIGTRHSRLVEALRRRGLHTYAKEDATLAEIQSFLRRAMPVIVHYREEDMDDEHYAVAVDIDDEYVYLNDPWHGEAFPIKREEFETRWLSGPEGKCERWFVAVSNAPIESIPEYRPSL